MKAVGAPTVTLVRSLLRRSQLSRRFSVLRGCEPRRRIVEEESYRQSRLCRLRGNPVAFAVVQLLAG